MISNPSIFNDVIGPVMRGPSSSHTAASWRIAYVCLSILDDKLHHALIEFDKDGAWAPNYREQGTCMGIEGGLLKIDISDPLMKETKLLAQQNKIDISYRVSSFVTTHPNTVRLTLTGISGKKLVFIAISTGGGAFEIQSVDGITINYKGDSYLALILSSDKISLPNISVEAIVDNNILFTKILSPYKLPTTLITELKEISKVKSVVELNPILPIVSGRDTPPPFTNIDSLLNYAKTTSKSLGQVGAIYESHRSGLTDVVLYQEIMKIISTIDSSINIGIEGTTYEDRILPQQSHLIAKAESSKKIKEGVVNRIIAYVSALMEAKSSMEVIVAVPTAGSCGAVGGALRAISENCNSTTEELANAYFAAGIIGVYIAERSGFSAEEHGCQVECGAASAMAAAGIAELMGASAKQSISASSMAMQNMVGMICDPVADRVEVPCLGKNINAAVNAHSSAIMAVSGFDPVIPFTEVIDTVINVSKSMPSCVKCTGRGGLAITSSAQRIKKQL